MLQNVNMNTESIKTKIDYQQALKRLELVFDARKETTEGDELEILGLLIDHYEDQHFPIDKPDPAEAIKFRVEQILHS
jgi:HTH-type transcriptional regulator/antitoxin HigA